MDSKRLNIPTGNIRAIIGRWLKDAKGDGVVAQPSTGEATGESPAGESRVTESGGASAGPSTVRDAVPAAAPSPAAPEQGPSQNDALNALEKVFTRKGMIEAQAVLKKYGVERLRDLDRKNYAAFVTDCYNKSQE